MIALCGSAPALTCATTDRFVVEPVVVNGPCSAPPSSVIVNVLAGGPPMIRSSFPVNVIVARSVALAEK